VSANGPEEEKAAKKEEKKAVKAEGEAAAAKEEKKDAKKDAKKPAAGGALFNAADFVTHSKDVLDKVDHHHVNCVLKASHLKPEDNHEELKAKHDQIKALASKLK